VILVSMPARSLSLLIAVVQRGLARNLQSLRAGPLVPSVRPVRDGGGSVAPRLFVIFGGQRTGSTLMRTRLNSHPHIVCHGEVLLPTVPREPSLRGWLAERGYPKHARVVPAVRHSFLESLVVGRQEHDVKALGLKLMYDQISLVPMISYNVPPVGRILHDVGMLRWLRDHDALIIHTLRRNHLKTVVSLARAAHTKEYHRGRESGPPDGVQITLPLLGLKARLNRIDLAERVARDAIKEMPTIEVWYEDYVGSQRGDVEKRICAELGQNVPAGGLQSPLVKVSSDNLREAISNYDEVAALLTGTRFEVFLES
jgi:LPS sulfotransferase NodH